MQVSREENLQARGQTEKHTLTLLSLMNVILLFMHVGMPSLQRDN